MNIKVLEIIKNYGMILVPTIVILIVFLTPFIMESIVTTSVVTGFYTAEKAEFGDMYGVVNALFSGLAFSGLIYTALLQKEELKLQRKELADTREVLQDQKNQLEAQTQLFNRQNFESTLFNLLNLHNDVVQKLSLKLDKGQYHHRVSQAAGREGFSSIHEFLKSWNSDPQGNSFPSSDAQANTINSHYKALYEKNKHQLMQYYGNVEFIINYIDNSSVGNKFFYIQVLKTQLSAYELAAIFYHAKSHPNFEQFKKMIEHYGLFYHLDQKLILNYPHEWYCYHEDAFLKNTNFNSD
ncbi:putative phage abortive infection protein [Methylobacillus flagellatus]|uniref:putative phage abortive infection protein n=1 Tax=Methylobacillus flagellatus TaxID=405 RepID=UPI0010F75CBC|nr:putative phage abortive infection protein [Methylobacillus flagellatus]